jgi:hypothetical protein
VYQQFKKHKLPDMLEEAEVTTAAQLDAKLRSAGSSLLKQQRMFLEQLVGKEMVQQNVDVNGSVSHDELLDYYHQHLDEYEFPARAKWEHLMVRWEQFTSRDDARVAMADMGNQVLRGAAFEAVARRQSQGPRAGEGGQYDWTSRGSLRSEVIDEALFSIPPGRLSRMLEDEDGVHIVRVTEREPAGRVPFEEVQDEMREAIRRQRFEEQVAEYLARLKQETFVWTVYQPSQNPAEELATPGFPTTR